MKIETMETGGGAFRTPPQGRPPAASAMPFLVATLVLERYGYQKAEPQRFARAHAERCCHLCHMPYASADLGRPCPHWFLMSYRDIQQFGVVFEMHGLSGVLHYLLEYAREESAPLHPHAMIDVDNEPGCQRLQLKVDGRRWLVELSCEKGSPHMTIELHTRSNRRPRLVLPATAADVAVMQDLVATVVGT